MGADIGILWYKAYIYYILKGVYVLKNFEKTLKIKRYRKILALFAQKTHELLSLWDVTARKTRKYL